MPTVNSGGLFLGARPAARAHPSLARSPAAYSLV